MNFNHVANLLYDIIHSNTLLADTVKDTNQNKSLTDLGARGTPDSSESNLFHFHVVFGQNYAK